MGAVPDKTFYIETFGCQMNVHDSEKVIGTLLREGYRQLLNQIYAPKAYYERVLTFLREYHPPEVGLPLDLQYTLALGRSIYHLGIRGVERAQYWRLFFWTLFRRPQLFPLAIRLSILGFHFRKVVELHVA